MIQKPQFSLADAVRSELKKPPPRFVLTGLKKIGKTMFGSQAPDVVFVPTEDGALGLEVPILAPPGQKRCLTWSDTIQCLDALATQPHDHQWVVIDTADEWWQMCRVHVCDEQFGGRWVTVKNEKAAAFDSYGKGEAASVQVFRQGLGLLDTLQQDLNMGVLLLCHDGEQRMSNMMGADYYKSCGALGKAWPLVANWADQIGFAMTEVRATSREGDKRTKVQAISSERWIMFEGGPALDAGCRAGYEMPEKIPLSWDEYARHLSGDRVQDLVDQVNDMLKTANGAQDVLKKRLGGEITDKALVELGQAKLDQLVGWLMTQQTQET